jgi:hypothetical protein
VIDARRHWLVIPGVPGPRLLGAVNDALDANQARAGAEEEDLVGESGTLAGGALQANVPRDAGVASPALRPVEGVIALPPLIGYLDGLLGRGWHLDHHIDAGQDLDLAERAAQSLDGKQRRGPFWQCRGLHDSSALTRLRLTDGAPVGR